MTAAPTLLLNASYEPLRVISWQRAVTMMCLGKVEVVRSYESVLRAMTWSVRTPAVVRLVQFVRRHRVRVAFSRRNVFVRDEFSCQYCGLRLGPGELTCDHVVPRSRGGHSSWENVVAACGPCNRRKGNRTPREAEMRLMRKPIRPASLPSLGLRLGGSSPPEPWRDFLLGNAVRLEA
jgi:5-methylcytosine-specific restriction endonuclease McrA